MMPPEASAYGSLIMTSERPEDALSRGSYPLCAERTSLRELAFSKWSGIP